jgi:hypothetical protein
MEIRHARITGGTARSRAMETGVPRVAVVPQNAGALLASVPQMV